MTWANSTVYAQTDFDQQLKDNLSFLYSPPSLLAYSTSNQSIPTNTNTAVNLATEVWDTDTMHSGTSATVDFNTAGVYLRAATGAFSISSTAGNRELYFADNGTDSNRKSEQIVSGVPTIADTWINICYLGLQTATDSFQMKAWQSSGGGLNVLAYTAWVLAHWCGNP